MASFRLNIRSEHGTVPIMTWKRDVTARPPLDDVTGVELGRTGPGSSPACCSLTSAPTSVAESARAFAQMKPTKTPMWGRRTRHDVDRRKPSGLARTLGLIDAGLDDLSAGNAIQLATAPRCCRPGADDHHRSECSLPSLPDRSQL